MLEILGGVTSLAPPGYAYAPTFPKKIVKTPISILDVYYKLQSNWKCKLVAALVRSDNDDKQYE